MASELTPEGWAGPGACPGCGSPVEAADAECLSCFTRTATEPREVLESGVAITKRRARAYDPLRSVEPGRSGGPDPFATDGPEARQWRAVV